MYALGATLVEVLTGRSPFPLLNNKQVELQVFAGKISLAETLPQDLDAEWQPLLKEIESYVQHDPQHRPSASQAIERLLALYPEYRTSVVRSADATPTTASDWSEEVDANSGDIYYYNSETAESVWSRPAEMGLLSAAQKEAQQLKVENARLKIQARLKEEQLEAQRKAEEDAAQRKADDDRQALEAQAKRRAEETQAKLDEVLFLCLFFFFYIIPVLHIIGTLFGCLTSKLLQSLPQSPKLLPWYGFF
jgi:hypothetical protein